MKEQNRTPEKELSDVDIANLSDAEFKTLVIRVLKDLIEYGKSIRERNEGSTKGNKEKSTGNQY